MVQGRLSFGRLDFWHFDYLENRALKCRHLCQMTQKHQFPKAIFLRLKALSATEKKLF